LSVQQGTDNEGRSALGAPICGGDRLERFSRRVFDVPLDRARVRGRRPAILQRENCGPQSMDAASPTFASQWEKETAVQDLDPRPAFGPFGRLRRHSPGELERDVALQEPPLDEVGQVGPPLRLRVP
jgi:hypothetical protein